MKKIKINLSVKFFTLTIYTSDIVEETFFKNIDEILRIWSKVWNVLNDDEKDIVKLLVENKSLRKHDLLQKLHIPGKIMDSYLKNLKDKGIIYLKNRTKEYVIEDGMFELWLKNQKEVNGTYPL